MASLDDLHSLPSAGPPRSLVSALRSEALLKRCFWSALILVLAFGCWVRLGPTPAFQGIGFDEALYRDYLAKLDRVGLVSYPEICTLYLETQRQSDATAKLPPTRFLYVGCAALWKDLFHRDTPASDPRQPGFAQRDPYLVSLKSVSALFSLLHLCFVPLFVWRMLGRNLVIPTTALMACAPIQVHMAQHALIDGFFSFWAMLALWLLWESLQNPTPRRLLGLGAAMAALVLAKENAFFVGTGLAALLLAARWFRFGKPETAIWLAAGAGTVAGVACLALLAGGFDVLFPMYKLLVAQASVLPYAIQTGDGPWHRYLVDLLITNPAVVSLAGAASLGSAWRTRAGACLVLFVGATYVLMCNVRYGMNLRYTTIWDLPLCALAAIQIRHWAAGWHPAPNGPQPRLPQFQIVLQPAVVGIACLSALLLYHRLFIEHSLYELATRGLLEALKILK